MTDANHSSDCDNHDDVDNIRGWCQATTRSKRPCALKPLTGDDEYLPVCHLHLSQAGIHKAARCLAIEGCGFRCNRLCVWTEYDERKPTCSIHEKTRLPCYFKTLPIELRIMIMEWLMPDGPVPSEFPSHYPNPYSAVAALARVNKEFSSHVEAIFYQSTSRPCIIDIKPGSKFHFAGQKFRLSIGAPLELAEYRPMYEIDQGCLKRFSNFDLHTSITSGEFQKSTMLHVLTAISTLKTATALRRPLPRVNLRIDTFVFAHIGQSKERMNEYVSSVIEGANNVLLSTKLFSIDLDWRLCFTIAERFGVFDAQVGSVELSMKEKSLHFVQRGQSTGATEHVVKEARAAFEGIRLFAMLVPSSFWLNAQILKWRTFQKLLAATRDLVEVGYLVHTDPEDIPGHFTFTAHFEFLRILEGYLEDPAFKSLDVVASVIDTWWSHLVADHESKAKELRDRYSGLPQQIASWATARGIIDRPTPRVRLMHFIIDHRREISAARTPDWADVIQASNRHAGVLITEPWGPLCFASTAS